MWDSTLGISRQYKKLDKLSESVKSVRRLALKSMLYWEETQLANERHKRNTPIFPGLFLNRGRRVMFIFFFHFLPLVSLSVCPLLFLNILWFHERMPKIQVCALYYTCFSWKYKKYTLSLQHERDIEWSHAKEELYLPTYPHTCMCISVKCLSLVIFLPCFCEHVHSISFLGLTSFWFTLFNTRNTQIYANSMWRVMGGKMNWKNLPSYCNQFACILPVGLRHFPYIYKLIQYTLL